MATLIPIDFNSLSQIEEGKIFLSDYYIDYAFEGKAPSDGMEIVFYDEGWIPDSDEIICFDGLLKNNGHSWYAELNGKIYKSSQKPERKYFTSFIGAGTYLLESAQQKVGDHPAKDKLAGISCFLYSPGSPLPRFSSIIGMDANELATFFQFEGLPRPKMENGKATDDNLFIRGGANKVR